MPRSESSYAPIIDRLDAVMNQVQRLAPAHAAHSNPQIINCVDDTGNLSLLRDYNVYLSVEKGLRPLTCEAYLGDLRTFAEFIESRNGVLLTAVQQDVSAFLEHLRKHGIESRSSARKLSCLRGFYKWLLLDRRIHHDPTVNIESPKAWKVLPKSLAEPEVAEMLERAGIAASHPQAHAAALRDRAILELLYAGGLRVSEVTALSTPAACTCAAKGTRNALFRWAAPLLRRLKLICAKDARIWRALARTAKPVYRAKTTCACFFPCAACRSLASGCGSW